MNFFSLFGPNIYSSNHESTGENSPPSSQNVLSSIFSSEIQELLAQVLNQPSSTTQETQTATAEDDLIYFETSPANTGLPLSLLTSRTTLGVKTDDAESTCVICHNNIEKNSIYRKINQCEHMFHVQCIDEWLQSNSTCPVCRLQIGNSEDEGATNRPRRTSTFLPVYSIRYA